MATTLEHRDEAAVVATGADHPPGGGVTSVPTTLPGLGKLSTALAKAQGEMKNAALNKTNPHFRSKYADLASIRDATFGPLSKHGLSIDHRFDYRYGAFCVIGELRHESGEMIESLFPLPANATSQALGSAITYGKRYTWAGLCGIAADEDDDANEATQANVATRGNSPSVARKAVAAAVRDEQRAAPKVAAKESYDILDIDHNVVATCPTAAEFLTDLAGLVKDDRLYWEPNMETVDEIESMRRDDLTPNGKATYGDWVAKLRSLAKRSPQSEIVA